MHEGVLHNFLWEESEFFLSWQLSPKDEIRHFEEAASFCQYLNGESPVLENTFVSINVADFWGTGNGIHIAGVIAAKNLSFVGKLRKITRFQETTISIQLMSLARSWVSDGDCGFGGDLVSDEC